MIEFLCPEGHKIRCPQERAGRPAKCPKCGVAFRIPTIEELGLEEPGVVDPALAEEESPSAPAPSPSRTPAPPSPSQERQIEFLCPNGHHLHGPASLQGRAGECPECGSRFRIPIVEEPEVESLAEPEVAPEPEIPTLEEEIRLESPTPLPEPEPIQSAETLEFVQVTEEVAPQPAKQPVTSGGTEKAIIESVPRSAGVSQSAHPLAALFIELWAARGENSRVEVHLESGSVLVPDGYVRSHSQKDYAVLVTRDPDGLSTVTIVPWKSISRIILRAMKQVPGEVVR